MCPLPTQIPPNMPGQKSLPSSSYLALACYYTTSGWCGSESKRLFFIANTLTLQRPMIGQQWCVMVNGRIIEGGRKPKCQKRRRRLVFLHTIGASVS